MGFTVAAAEGLFDIYAGIPGVNTALTMAPFAIARINPMHAVTTYTASWGLSRKRVLPAASSFGLAVVFHGLWNYTEFFYGSYELIALEWTSVAFLLVLAVQRTATIERFLNGRDQNRGEVLLDVKPVFAPLGFLYWLATKFRLATSIEGEEHALYFKVRNLSNTEFQGGVLATSECIIPSLRGPTLAFDKSRVTLPRIGRGAQVEPLGQVRLTLRSAGITEFHVSVESVAQTVLIDYEGGARDALKIVRISGKQELFVEVLTLVSTVIAVALVILAIVQ